MGNKPTISECQEFRRQNYLARHYGDPSYRPEKPVSGKDPGDRAAVSLASLLGVVAASAILSLWGGR